MGTVFLVIPQGLPLQSGTAWTCLGLPSAIMDTSIDEPLSSIDGTSEATPIDLSEATDDGPLSSLVDHRDTPLEDLKRGNQLEWSTVDAESFADRKSSHSSKTCVFCGLNYTGGPLFIRIHLDKAYEKRRVRLCEPKVNWVQRHGQVVAAIRNREAAAHGIQRLGTSRTALVHKPLVKKSLSDVGPLATMKPTPAQVNEQFMRALAKKGLSMDLVDDDEFRAAVTMACRAGQSFVDGAKGDSMLVSKKTMTNRVLPELDEKLHTKVSKKIDGLIEETGALLISDGWTSISRRPIINCLLSTPAGTVFLKAKDTSTHTKDAQYIADFVCESIEERGPKHIVAVCMDGACTASFPIITLRYPHIFCFICPAHSVDNFLKNVCSDQATISVRSITEVFEWDSSVFSDPIADSWEVIKFITNHGKSLAIFRQMSRPSLSPSPSPSLSPSPSPSPSLSPSPSPSPSLSLSPSSPSPSLSPSPSPAPSH